jgi:hypothetical protein
MKLGKSVVSNGRFTSKLLQKHRKHRPLWPSRQRTGLRSGETRVRLSDAPRGDFFDHGMMCTMCPKKSRSISDVDLHFLLKATILGGWKPTGQPPCSEVGGANDKNSMLRTRPRIPPVRSIRFLSITLLVSE